MMVWLWEREGFTTHKPKGLEDLFLILDDTDDFNFPFSYSMILMILIFL